MQRLVATYNEVLDELLSRKWFLPVHALAGALMTGFLVWLCQGFIWQMIIAGLFVFNTFWFFAAWETGKRLLRSRA